jgi:hypothetical protein
MICAQARMSIKVVLGFALLGAVHARCAPGQDTQVEALLKQAAAEPDADGAGAILSKLLTDDTLIRSALLKARQGDERSIFVLFGGNWGTRVNDSRESRRRWQRTLSAAVSADPTLIQCVIRADRYATYLERKTGKGASTANEFTFFERSPYVDDILEFGIEALRRQVNGAAGPIISLDGFVLRSAEEVEDRLLDQWQVVCGACDRLDLIENATTKNWRNRFNALDSWFQRNRPYMLWDDTNSCARVDRTAMRRGIPTLRKSRIIPDLKPPWMSSQARHGKS